MTVLLFRVTRPSIKKDVKNKKKVVNKTKQNKTKQNKTKHNITKQNNSQRSKQIVLSIKKHWNETRTKLFHLFEANEDNKILKENKIRVKKKIQKCTKRRFFQAFFYKWLKIGTLELFFELITYLIDIH